MMRTYRQVHSLRARLLLTYIGLIILGFGGLTWLAGRQLSSGSQEDFAKKLDGDAALVASAIVELVEHYLEDEASDDELLAALITYEGVTEATITLIGPEGQPWATSAADLSAVPVVSFEADSPQKRQQQDAQGVYHTVVPIMYEGELLSWVQLSAADTILQEAVSQRLRTLGVGFIIFAVLGLLLSLWISSTLTNPLSRLRNGALAIARGDLSQRISPLRNDEIGAVGEAFNQMAAQVAAMLEEQRSFASNASHELRTPLTTIRLRTELLQQGELEPDITKQYIDEIDQEATRLGGLVDDLILLSRLEAKRLEIGEEQVDPRRLALQLMRELTPVAEAGAIKLTLGDVPELPPVHVNLNHLTVVFRNLLENAIKYTQAGGEITWQFEKKDDFIQVVIRDNGLGIAAEDLPQVNQRFYRTDKARSRRIEGVGLGLSLVQSIVNLYGGRFQIDSPGLGQGTTVMVWWPIHPLA